MAKANEPTIPPGSICPGGKAPGSRLRDQVRQRMLKMAPLALAAAAPLTNAACDPAPTPCQEDPSVFECTLCRQVDPSFWVDGSAVWDTVGGVKIVILDLVPSYAAIGLPGSYTIVGGTLLPSTSAPSTQMRIRPDAGATVIRLAGSVTCTSDAVDMKASLSLVVTVNLLPPDGGSPDDDPTVKIGSY
jgi:hypothetical protein